MQQYVTGPLNVISTTREHLTLDPTLGFNSHLTLNLACLTERLRPELSIDRLG